MKQVTIGEKLSHIHVPHATHGEFSKSLHKFHGDKLKYSFCFEFMGFCSSLVQCIITEIFTAPCKGLPHSLQKKKMPTFLMMVNKWGSLSSNKLKNLMIYIEVSDGMNSSEPITAQSCGE